VEGSGQEGAHRPFRPGIIRTALDKRDGYTSGQRKKIYDLISEYASHASYPGMWLEELAKQLGHAAIVVLSDFEGEDHVLDLTRKHYLT
jgi:hypothetical protein